MHTKQRTITMAHLADSMRYVNHVLRSYFKRDISNVHKGHHETHTHSESDLHTLKCNCDVRKVLDCNPLDLLCSQSALKWIILKHDGKCCPGFKP